MKTTTLRHMGLGLALVAASACTDEDRTDPAGHRQELLVGPQEASFRFPAGAGPETLPLATSESLRLASRVQILSAGAPAPVANLGSGQTEIGVRARTADVYAGGSVRIGNRASIEGDVTAGGAVALQQGAEVTGAVTENAALPSGTEIRLTIAWPKTSSGPQRLEPGSVRTLSPGAYDEVDVKPRARINLSAGTYHFASLTLHPQATLSLGDGSGPVVIHVAGDLTIRGRLEAPSGFDQILFVVLGNRVDIERDMVGTVFAPSGEISVKPQAKKVRGALYGRVVRIEPGVEVQLARFDWNQVTELIIAGNTGPQEGTREEGTGPDKGGQTFPAPAPDPKLDPDAVTVPSPEQVRATHGDAAKNLPTLFPETPGAGPQLIGPAGPSTGFYGRVLLELSSAGVNPRAGQRIEDGPLRSSETVDGPLLAVVEVGGSPEHAVTLPDPRSNHAAAPPGMVSQGHSLGGNAVATLRLSLPSRFLADANTVRSIEVKLYAMANTVSRNTHVILGNLSTLLDGATLIGSIPGDDIRPFFFANPPPPVIK